MGRIVRCAPIIPRRICFSRFHQEGCYCLMTGISKGILSLNSGGTLLRSRISPLRRDRNSLKISTLALPDCNQLFTLIKLTMSFSETRFRIFMFILFRAISTMVGGASQRGFDPPIEKEYYYRRIMRNSAKRY